MSEALDQSSEAWDVLVVASLLELRVDRGGLGLAEAADCEALQPLRRADEAVQALGRIGSELLESWPLFGCNGRPLIPGLEDHQTKALEYIKGRLLSLPDDGLA